MCYCKSCQIEYLVNFPKCNHCREDTITREKQIEALQAKFEEYKKRKSEKKMRLTKWNDWCKNQVARYSKMGINYQKWEDFESGESSEEEKILEVIDIDDKLIELLEKNIDKKDSLKQQNRKKAEEIKVVGNNYLKEGKYRAARKKYSQAIELSKDFFVLYTNRALASLKIEMWNDVVDDCTRILDRCECFDEGYIKQKDLCFKALTRRAIAFQEMHKYVLAKADVEEALKLYPGLDETVKLLKKINENIELDKKTADIIKSSKENELIQ